MATITVTKALAGVEDLQFQSSATETFSRTKSDGTAQTMTRFASHIFLDRWFNVMDFGAVGDGTTDDYTAIAACIDKAETAGGGVIYFPPGYTFMIHVQAVDSRIITLTSSNLTFWGYGATLKTKCLTARQATTWSLWTKTSFVFCAVGKENINFFGLTFDGNRNEAESGYIDPRYGMFVGKRCNRITVRDCTFQHIVNVAISGRPRDSTVVGDTIAALQDWDISDNYWYRCFGGFFIGGPESNVTISGNHFKDQDITVDSGANTKLSFSAQGLVTTGPRNIRVDGYDSVTTTADGDCKNIVITGNTVDGGTIGIELYNNDDTNGDNPEHAYGVTITGNTLRCHDGINLNGWSNSVIDGNSIRHIPSEEMAAYGGKKWQSDGDDGTADTTTPVFVGIEARPGWSNVVSNNNIDGGWYESGGVDQTDSEFSNGIVMGIFTEDIPESWTVSGNVVRRCYFGIKLDQCQHALVENNDIRECKTALMTNWSFTSSRPTGLDWLDNICRGNNFELDPNAGESGGSGTNMVKMEGAWLIEGNTFTGRASMASGSKLLLLQGFESVVSGGADIGDFVLRGNTFRKYNNTPVDIYGAAATCARRVHFDGNLFDSESASPGANVCCIRILRPVSGQSLTMTAGQNIALRHAKIFDWIYTSAGTESYDLGNWKHDGQVTQISCSVVAGANNATTYAANVPVDAPFGVAGVIRGKTVQIDCDSGATTQTIASFFPAHAIILGVSARVNTIIVASGGTPTWSLGLTGNTTAWGTTLALAANTVVGPNNWVGAKTDNIVTGTSAVDLVLTLSTNNFSSGRVVVQAQYLVMGAETL